MELTKEDIIKAYATLQKQKRIYEENEQYACGANPAILRKDRKKDPDNRMPIPLAKGAIEDLTGYAGSNITISYDEVTEGEEAEGKSKDQGLEAYREFFGKIQDYNDDDLVTTELYMEALSQRTTYLLLWTSNNLKLDNGLLTPEYAVSGTNEIVIIWSKSKKPEMLAAVRFVCDEESDEKEATVYYPGVWVTDEAGQKTEKIAQLGYYQMWKEGKNGWDKEGEKNEYPFMKVPVIEFKISKRGGPLFQAEKTIIDKIDETMSKTQNEIDRFNALVMLFPGKVDAEFVKKLEELKVIDELGEYEHWPEYMEKNLEGVNEYTKNHLDRLERLFHKCIKVVDFNQIAAEGGDESGVARAFKLLGMEFKAKQIEKVFKKGFYERTELINDIIKFSTWSIDTSKYTTEIEMKRDLPVDELAKIQIAEGLKRLGLSDEQILKMLPGSLNIDVEKELLSMEKKEAERQEQFANMLTDGGQSE